MRLQDEQNMIQVMELDLVTKVKQAFDASGLQASIFGVFSLDDLENRLIGDLCQRLAAGVGFYGVEPAPPEQNPNVTSARVKHLSYIFHIIFAVPTGASCEERQKATALMQHCIKRILGTHIDGDTTNRTWDFVKAGPNISESTDTMLYYSQVWRVAIPVSGPKL